MPDSGIPCEGETSSRAALRELSALDQEEARIERVARCLALIRGFAAWNMLDVFEQSAFRAQAHEVLAAADGGA